MVREAVQQCRSHLGIPDTLDHSANVRFVVIITLVCS
jgi:hypothetical protein